jgi:hypothetical protein
MTHTPNPPQDNDEPVCSTCEVVETDCDCYDGKYERASRAL